MEAIPKAVDGLDPIRISGVIAKLGTQILYVTVYRPNVGERVIAKGRTEELLSGEGASMSRHQCEE